MQTFVLCVVFAVAAGVGQALGIQSEKAPSIDVFGLQHLLVEGLLNFGHNAPFSGPFYKLANPVDARD